MSLEFTGRGEFSELVSDHVFGDEDGDMLVSIVDSKGDADEFRGNRAATGPGLDDSLFITHSCYFFQETGIYVRAFFR